MPLGQPNVQDDSSRMSSKKGGVFTPPFSMVNYNLNKRSAGTKTDTINFNKICNFQIRHHVRLDSRYPRKKIDSIIIKLYNINVATRKVL